MIAIACLFVCILCDCIKSRWQLEADYPGIAASAQRPAAARPTPFAFALADRALFIKELFAFRTQNPGFSTNVTSVARDQLPQPLGNPAPSGHGVI